MHETTSSEKRKALQKEAGELAMEARTTLKQPVFCHRAIPKPLCCSRRRTGSVRR